MVQFKSQSLPELNLSIIFMTFMCSTHSHMLNGPDMEDGAHITRIPSVLTAGAHAAAHVHVLSVFGRVWLEPYFGSFSYFSEEMNV